METNTLSTCDSLYDFEKFEELFDRYFRENIAYIDSPEGTDFFLETQHIIRHFKEWYQLYQISNIALDDITLSKHIHLNFTRGDTHIRYRFRDNSEQNDFVRCLKNENDALRNNAKLQEIQNKLEIERLTNALKEQEYKHKIESLEMRHKYEKEIIVIQELKAYYTTQLDKFQKTFKILTGESDTEGQVTE